jgi:hypothetical protein
MQMISDNMLLIIDNNNNFKVLNVYEIYNQH